MTPRLIAVMGEPAWRFASSLSPQLRHWSSGRVDPVSVGAVIDDVSCTVVPLLHPSGLWTTERFRNYKTLDDAFEREAELLRDGGASAAATV